MCRRQAGDGHAVRRAAHVVETHLVEEMDGRGDAAVLAADPELDVGSGLAALLHGHSDEAASADRVDRREGITVENFLLLIDAEELAGIVAREAERELR